MNHLQDDLIISIAFFIGKDIRNLLHLSRSSSTFYRQIVLTCSLSWFPYAPNPIGIYYQPRTLMMKDEKAWDHLIALYSMHTSQIVRNRLIEMWCSRNLWKVEKWKTTLFHLDKSFIRDIIRYVPIKEVNKLLQFILKKRSKHWKWIVYIVNIHPDFDDIDDFNIDVRTHLMNAIQEYSLGRTIHLLYYLETQRIYTEISKTGFLALQYHTDSVTWVNLLPKIIIFLDSSSDFVGDVTKSKYYYANPDNICNSIKILKNHKKWPEWILSYELIMKIAISIDPRYNRLST